MDAVTETKPSNVSAAARSTTYRFAPGWRIAVAILYGAILCAALAGIYGISVTFRHMPIGRTVISGLVLLALAAGTAWQLVIFLTWRLTLADDAIETFTWWTTRRLRRDEIDGYRFTRGGGIGTVLVIVPATAGSRKINLLLRYIQKDNAFAAWFSGLRDLNVVEMQSSVAGIAANATFGATPEARLRRLTRARRIAGVLDFAAIGVVLWCFIWPQPYPLLIASLAALPVLALILVVASRGLFRIGIGATDAHANLGTLCALPACAIVARMLFDLNMIDWTPLIAAAVVCTAIFMAALAIADRGLRRQRWMLLGVGLLTGAYALGAIGEANALLDRSPASIVRSQILEKHVTYGKRTTYHFQLAPWGPLTEASDVSVSRELYDRLEPGNPACLLLRSGALGMPWFIVLPCR